MILKIALVFFVSAVEFGVPTGRVLGGSNVPARTYPFNAAIHFKKLFLCSGAFIGRNYILTTAECVEPYSTGPALADLTVKLDSIKSEHEPTVFEYSVFGVTIHPLHSTTSGRVSNNRDFAFHLNNIAIIRLTSVVTLVSSVAMPDRGAGPVIDGTDVIVIGWGKQHGIVNDLLQSADVVTMSVANCIRLSGGDPTVGTSNNLCTDAFDPANGRPETACTTDHGAPLIEKRLGAVVLQGLVSWASCEWENAGIKPTIYTSIVGHREWIFQQTAI